MAETFNPSKCEILKAIVKPFGDSGAKKARDITGLISNFAMTQSIESTAIHATFECYDTIGLLENLPIRGEEEIDVEIKAYDLDTLVRLKGHIYRVDEVEPVKARDGLVYTLSVITKPSYESSLHKVVTAFRNKKASTIAHEIFKKYYSNTVNDTSSVREELPYEGKKFIMENNQLRSFYLQPTEGLVRLTIPRYTPSEALWWVSTKSFSKNSPSCSFRFFENFDGFQFVTDEFLIAKAVVNKEVKNLNYTAFSSLDPRDATTQITTIESMVNTRRADVGQELTAGAYYNSVYEIDLNNHKATRYNFNYIDEIKKKNFKSTKGTNTPPVISSDIHTEQFIRQTFNDENAKQYMIFRDYDIDESGGKGPIVRGEQFYKEIVQNRSVYNLHLNATQVTATMKGRLDIQCGQVVNVNARKFNADGNQVQNTQLSGKYLVKSVSHTVKESILDTKMVLIKYDWNKG